MAWASITKCVLGAASIRVRIASGMLSRGVMPPESISSGTSTRMTSNPNCGIERATVARKMPIEVAAKRWNSVPARKSATEPSIGTDSSPCTMTVSDRPQATVTTSAIAQSLAVMISNGVTGMASRCSMVPCSRSRISAAPVSTMASSVTLLISSITEPNQDLSSPGLKRALSASSTGRSLSAR